MKIIIDFPEANYKALKMGAERGLALSVEHRAILNGIVLDESQGMVYKIKDITEFEEPICFVTTDKEKAKECVRRLNAISRYNDNERYEIEEGEDDVLSYVMASEKYAIEKAHDAIHCYSKDLAKQEKTLATLRKLKEKLDPMMTNTEKAPKDMVPEMVKAIQGINLDVSVVEYFSPHKLLIYSPDGIVRTETRENYCTGSHLHVNRTRWRYEEKWDIDDDIRYVEKEIEDTIREINDAKKFIAERTDVVVEDEQKGE